ncbi:MAG: NADH:flavin oxidoreductase/NADH oxidase [Burkholderiales bacterium]|nr:NADH:flavin oxidoreductase/NADH oxidase [Burkholderiales bacterium]
MPSSAPAAPTGPHLFTPFTMRGLTLPNRLVVSPMCQYSADEGHTNDWHVVHLGQMAMSGAGLLLIEATAVEPIGRITPGCVGLWDDATEAALARTLAAIRPLSTMPIGIQIGHAGRKGASARPWEGGAQVPLDAGGWIAVAPSAVPHAEHELAPRALDEAGLDALIERFADSTRRAARLGLEAIELHAAHGYLLHQFLSPIANRRTDRWGGSLENRMRFPLAVFDAMRAAWPSDRPLGVRVSSTDWVEGGWDIEQTVAFARALAERGCDWIDASSGGVSPKQSIPIGPGYQVPFAARLKAELDIPVIAVGLITEPAQAEAIVADGRADLVALARGLLWNPRWPWHAAAALGASVTAPEQYWRAQPREYKDVFGEIRVGQR